MKPVLVVVTLLLPATIAQANTKSVLDARATALKRWGFGPGTSGIGSGANSRKVPAPATDTRDSQDHLTR
jgi:hypothetical protein